MASVVQQPEAIAPRPQTLPAQFQTPLSTGTASGVVTSIPFPKTKANVNPNMKMKAATFKERKQIEIIEKGVPMITEPGDAIIHITTSAICGTDLSIYRAEAEGVVSGSVLGHEGVGIVYQVGEGVTSLRPGDKVVISAVLACGKCFSCKEQNYGCCDSTNPNPKLEEEFGQRGAAVFGCSSLKGGYDGLQAEYARVPFADVNCLRVTESPLTDERLIWLSDALCTGWYATELANVKPGSTVAIWGCGPVGLAAALSARHKGASTIVGIDYLPYRLQKATQIGVNYTIDPAKERVLPRLKEIAPSGFDCCVDAAGFILAAPIKHKVRKFFEWEESSPDAIREATMAARKGGTIAVVGEYLTPIHGFPINAFAEKALSLRTGHVPVQKYWRHLLGLMETNQIDPLPLVSHSIPLDRAPAAYVMFEKHRDNVIKVLLRTQSQA